VVPAAQAQLVGVEGSTGTLYNISILDGPPSSVVLTEIGQTGLDNLGSIEFNPHDNTLYGLTTGDHAALHTITLSPSLDAIVSVDLIGELGIFAFEGGMAFAPDGTAYAVNGGVTTPALVTLNLGTGEATAVGFLDGRRDIAGLGWRSDGMLMGLDSTTNTLVTIDPATAETAWFWDSELVGRVGGMVMAGTDAYYATANAGDAQYPGSNRLYGFDPLIPGPPQEIGLFGNWSMDDPDYIGISGLAIVPEPATLGLLLLGGLGLLRRRVT
jgi:hypothetical protein